MRQTGVTWATALAEAGCYDFLEPVAVRAVDAALDLCPKAATLVGDDARKDMLALCLSRIGAVYERPLILLAIRRVGLSENLGLQAGGERGAGVMRRIARDVRDEVMADAGSSLRERLPLAEGYEHTVAGNFSKAMAEFLERLLLRRDEVSRELLEGRPLTRVTGLSASGADPHRHGRMVMRVDTDAGSIFYKPHDCRLDELFLELVGTWFPVCARAARLVAGDGYAFVERLVPEGLADKGELRAYWLNLGCLTALFHALGSRDMTQDNIMCCGTRPAALDLETLLTGEMGFEEEGLSAEGIPADVLADSVICTAILPVPMGRRFFSPLVVDNESGSCLPRVGGEPFTVRGYEGDFFGGFEEGYRLLMRHRGEMLEVLGRHADSTCRQILLNTWAYAKSRALLFSPGAMSGPERRDEVLAGLNAKYGAFSQELRRRVFEPDASALTEGDIPYYCSRAGSRALYAGEGQAVGELLERSALEVATSRIERLSEDDLHFELGFIHRFLSMHASSGGRS